MKPTLPGIHHVTAITADGKRNVAFYTGVLGLRMVKVTVNFDDPSAYHLYYGDFLGRPGSAMTFFVWEGARGGRVGAPQVVVTQFAIPVGARAYWQERLAKAKITATAQERLGESVLAFEDPDGLALELVEVPLDSISTFEVGADSVVPVEYAIRGFYGVTLASYKPDSTRALLSEVMGFPSVDETSSDRTRHKGAASYAAVVDVLNQAELRHGQSGAGTVHHVAFRSPDAEQQKAWQAILQERGLAVSPVMERCYFQSIYFREPGGILFEIATDEPGFTIDEPAESLGERVCLPPWMEENRAQIEASLPPL